MELRVECYAGYRSDETPRAFFIGDRRIEVVEVLDRWLDPDHRSFKIRGENGNLYILRHDVPGEKWDLTLFRSAAMRETGLSPSGDGEAKEP
jgi:hypothetical protein